MVRVVRVETVLYMINIEFLSVRIAMQGAGYRVGEHVIWEVGCVGVHVGFSLMLEGQMIGTGRGLYR